MCYLVAKDTAKHGCYVENYAWKAFGRIKKIFK